MRLRVREKIGFSLGDMAGNFVYQSVVLLLAFYYTDVFGLEATTVTTIFLAVRIFDALTDPLMGAIVDRTQTRWGKYRPYLLWLCVPYAVISIFVFTVPDFDPGGRTAYAFVTYGLLTLFFTATNIPYFALGSVITADPVERVSLNAYRFVAATTGGLLVTALLIPLADHLGGGDKAVGYRQAMTVMAGLSVVLFVTCFLTTRERVNPLKIEKPDLKQDARFVFSNDQWRLLGAAILVLVVAQTVKATVAIYYLTYYANDAGHLVSWFLSLWMIGGIIGSALAAPVTRRFCKKKTWTTLCLLSAALSASTYFIGADLLFAILAMNFVVGLVNQMMAPLIFSTMADVVDYGELAFRRRLDGLISSATIFALKIGLAVGGALATFLLAKAGYESGGVAQDGGTVTGILVIFTLVPAVGFVVAGLLVHRMKLTSRVVGENSARLAQLRETTATSS